MTELQKNFVSRIIFYVISFVFAIGMVAFMFVQPELACKIYTYVFGGLFAIVVLAAFSVLLVDGIKNMILDYRIRGILTKEEYRVYENISCMVTPPETWPEIKEKTDAIRLQMKMKIEDV